MRIARWALTGRNICERSAVVYKKRRKHDNEPPHAPSPYDASRPPGPPPRRPPRTPTPPAQTPPEDSCSTSGQRTHCSCASCSRPLQPPPRRPPRPRHPLRRHRPPRFRRRIRGARRPPRCCASSAPRNQTGSPFLLSSGWLFLNSTTKPENKNSPLSLSLSLSRYSLPLAPFAARYRASHSVSGAGRCGEEVGTRREGRSATNCAQVGLQ
jgi:hypothetical protein